MAIEPASLFAFPSREPTVYPISLLPQASLSVYRTPVLHLPKRSLCPLVFILLHLQNPLRISSTPFDPPSRSGLANDDASRFVDETTITRYSVSTIRK